MQDDLSVFDTSLADLPNGPWLQKISEISEEHGYFQALGKRHFATFFGKKPILLVTFETVATLRATSPNSHPFGWELFKENGWSHLSIISDGDTWFRDPKVYAYFDRLVDDGFFDDFDQVVFYGAGPCGYAAAAFSVAAPGATVVAIQPQATLDPRVTEWDDRHVKMRRTDFTSRYGYAPDMLDAAEQAYVIYDPYERLDAAHAAMFTRSNVKKLRVPNLGASLQSVLIKMEILKPLLLAAGDHNLTNLKFAKLLRARRDNRWYLHKIMAKLDAKERDTFTRAVCNHVISQISQGRAPRFERKLKALDAKLIAED
ncbi:MAG TPA: phosphoadenosine phosphosulfate reductase [Sulfitobacter sp.]|nr:phosphoadenosine phosphosulfate reductase [Sulfitobacter sp.]